MSVCVFRQSRHFDLWAKKIGLLLIISLVNYFISLKICFSQQLFLSQNYKFYLDMTDLCNFFFYVLHKIFQKSQLSEMLVCVLWQNRHFKFWSKNYCSSTFSLDKTDICDFLFSLFDKTDICDFLFSLFDKTNNCNIFFSQFHTRFFKSAIVRNIGLWLTTFPTFWILSKFFFSSLLFL